MRSKVASRSNGHAFEKRFLDLSLLQLVILYKQAIKEENEELKNKFEVINVVNKVWFDRTDVLFKNLQMFINPKLYKAFEDHKELDQHRKEINADNFMETWDELMSIVPEEYIIDESVKVQFAEEELDDDIAEMLSGWISRSQRNEEGE